MPGVNAPSLKMNQPTQSFGDSLLAASKEPAEAHDASGKSDKSTHRQKSDAQADGTPSSSTKAPDLSAEAVVPQTVPVPMPQQSSIPVVSAAAEVSDQTVPAAKFVSGLAKGDEQTRSVAGQAISMLPGQTSLTSARPGQGIGTTAASDPQSNSKPVTAESGTAVANTVSSSDPSSVADAQASTAAPVAAVTTSADPSAPVAGSVVAKKIPATDVVDSDQVAAAGVQLPMDAATPVSGLLADKTAMRMPSAAAMTVPASVARTSALPAAVASVGAVAKTVQSPVVSQAVRAPQVDVASAPAVAAASHSTQSFASPVTAASLATAPLVAAVPAAVSAPHAVAANAPTPIATAQASVPSTDSSTTVPVSVPTPVAEQAVAASLLSGGLAVTSLKSGAGLGQVSGVDASTAAGGAGKSFQKDATTAVTSLKTGDKSTASQSSVSQTDGQSGSSSGDQGQSGSSQSGQSMAPVQASFVNHTVAADGHLQNGAILSQAQPAGNVSASTDQAGKTSAPAAATPASVPVPETAPVINTAKLIQSMGQSEMRVGMNSTEFGNISIRTSSTRDVISAQISLDHGDLAKALAVHLPEMQAKLGSNAPADVRIDMNGQTAGQGSGHGTGTSAGMSNGSSADSRGARQQQSGTTDVDAGNGIGTWQTASAAATTNGGGLSSRLDIRV
jgi:hypothetical protein